MSGARLLFLSKGEESASTRYRALVYFDRLRADGHLPIHRPVGTNAASLIPLLGEIRRADLVVVLRRSLGPLAAMLLRRAARRLVFDLDDAIFLRSNGQPSPQREQAFARMAGRCDQVWAGNGWLAAAARRYSARVAVIPTCLDAERYLPSRFPETGHLELVWVGSSSTRKYLEGCLPALQTLAGSFSGLRLNQVSNFELAVPGLEIRNIPWSPAAEVEALAQAHIGIAPTPDDPWTRGKCGFKILQYMAAGLPVVASPVGANADLVVPGVTGLLPQDGAWVDALGGLLADRDGWVRLGAAGRERLMAEFTTARNYRRIAGLIAELVSGEAAAGTS